MPFNGNGQWTSVYYPTDDRDNGIPISADKTENLIQNNLKQSFQKCMTIDSQTKPTANIDANNFKVINVADPTLPKDAVNKQTFDAAINAITLNSITPVGHTKIVETNTVEAGWLSHDGQELSRATYADLWDWVQTNTTVVTEAAWQAGEFGKFSDGDGSTTFRMPDFRGQFMRIHDDGAGVDPDALSRAGGDTVGSVQSFALENMTGAIAAETGITSVSGVFNTGGGTGNNNGMDHVNTSAGSVRFDASNVAQTSTETRPTNVYLKMLIKY
ncbi:MAG: putative tail fiber protein [Prokaryotic dsDNA virus sp.]|nr:MAG: putative tail fiber protein [Prokaryotic dsDNA virus sp.]|tara:strand:+ start:21993 stop:22808 length:816 start_codon:yes stop_codon:yes gene_type:complete